MNRKITLFVLFIALGCATLFSIGCSGGGGNNQDPHTGFYVIVTAANIPTSAQLHGNFLPGSGAGNFGEQTTVDIQHTNGVGLTQIPNAKVPGTWRLTYGPDVLGGSLCLGFLTVDRNVNLGSQETLPCVPRFYSFTASPDTIDALNPPATITFSGKGVETLSGIPMLAYYDEFGNVVASSPANEVIYSGGLAEAVSANVPDLSLVYDGTYTLAVHNVNSDGTWELVGAATITIYGNPPPPPDDGGGGGCEPPLLNQPQLPCDPQF